MRNILLQWPTGTQISHGFKVHNVITCASKVQAVVSLGRYWVLFALGRHWVLTNGKWHVLLQSGNVFELGGITIIFHSKFGCGAQTMVFGWQLHIFLGNKTLRQIESHSFLLEKYNGLYTSQFLLLLLKNKVWLLLWIYLLILDWISS